MRTSLQFASVATLLNLLYCLVTASAFSKYPHAALLHRRYDGDIRNTGFIAQTFEENGVMMANYSLHIEGTETVDEGGFPAVTCGMEPMEYDLVHLGNLQLSCESDSSIPQNHRVYLIRVQSLREPEGEDYQPPGTNRNIDGVILTGEGEVFGFHVGNIFDDGKIQCDAGLPPFKCELKAEESIKYLRWEYCYDCWD